MYFELYDGEAFITFDIVYLNEKKMEVQFAVTNRGKISFVTYDLRESEKSLGKLPRDFCLKAVKPISTWVLNTAITFIEISP